MRRLFADLASRARAVAQDNRALLSNAGSMVATAVVTSLLGAAFWWVATHYFTKDSVGIASAAISIPG